MPATTLLIIKQVIHEAKILLKQTDWTIANIAYSLGFDDLGNFSNYFKSKPGFTPLEFRA
ncbi:helix-turn-helix domain-containing protein [Mucilaginibacter sp. UR6-1]|uniref:helix-turn-helix domain-containing protein n=1 Tax=Mucilaginibacter sp. UR6-1 TaxID=1435643 RepID=UPI00351D7AAC